METRVFRSPPAGVSGSCEPLGTSAATELRSPECQHSGDRRRHVSVFELNQCVIRPSIPCSVSVICAINTNGGRVAMVLQGLHTPYVFWELGISGRPFGSSSASPGMRRLRMLNRTAHRAGVDRQGREAYLGPSKSRVRAVP